ncbi:hypothetical protein B0A48_12818 [Cryoendolithus antarcticus]|uniref:GRIP domain-containing protein n=1 Tax=Cryoendolithus antarcticus TaxID=1507870 RepID=A0A1V8SQ18_9PEZI|nr:hypothetical protein B0A48_12818 [Cryoendolithus antarcticus]
MFQKLKSFNLDNFLDSKIAEEQAKQNKPGQSGSPAKRSTSNVRRGSGRTDSPSRRAGGKLKVPDADGGDGGKAPDPDDFVIGDDASDISRVATPRPIKEGDAAPTAEDAVNGEQNDTSPSKGKEAARPDDNQLPEDVTQKLARLETLSMKYKELLRNYRAAHARVSQTDAFEATLREHTPLANISDPGALVEFLNLRGLQSEMVLQELKRITGEQRDTVRERDELKVKLDEAEKKAKDAFDEAAGLKKEREEQAAAKAVEAQKSKDVEGAPVADLAKAAGTDEKDGSTFFSYDSDLEAQVKEQTEKISEQRAYILELETENASTHQDFEMTRLDLEAMKNKITIRDREITSVSDQLNEARSQITELEKSGAAAREEQDSAVGSLVAAEAQCVDMQERLKAYQIRLQKTHEELESKAAAAESNAEAAKENLQKYQAEHEKNLKFGKVGGEAQEKRMKTYQDVIEGLKEQLRQSEADKKVMVAANKTMGGQTEDLMLQTKLMMSEASSRKGLIDQERAKCATAMVNQQRAEERLQEAIEERERALRLAESKKGHEAAVAGLKGQLKRAERDRDQAYKLILNCGKCKTEPEEMSVASEAPSEMSNTPRSRSRQDSDTTELTESTQPTEVSTPSGEVAEPDAADTKKSKKKKKSKAKKKAGTDEATPGLASVAELEKATANLKDMNDPAVMKAITDGIKDLQDSRNAEDDSAEQLRLHHEEIIETRNQTIKDLEFMLLSTREESNSHRKSLQKEHEEVQRLQLAMQEQLLKGASVGELEKLRESIKAKDEAIDRLDAKLKCEEELKEEIEMMRDSMTELASESTDAKHALQLKADSLKKLQTGFGELQMETDQVQKRIKDAEAQRDDLARRCTGLETEILELKTAHASAGSVSAGESQGLKDAVEATKKESAALKLAKETMEKELEVLKTEHNASGAERDEKHRSQSSDFEKLKSRADTLDTDLTAANQLAQTRFKDLTDLREHTGKVQAELKRLRDEVANLKNVKTDLEKSSSAVKRLESKERDLRSEIAEYKAQSTDKDTQISDLRVKAKGSEERCKALEDTYERARKDLESNEQTRDEAVETRDKLQQQLDKALVDTRAAKAALQPLEDQVAKLGSEASTLREELQVKSAQQQSAQSLMASMQDQSRELATQMKEVRERCESLDEELADAHRLLSERSREGDTMRRLLQDVESRAESRVKEMRERMDLAVEERDRAEEEASTIGRRKARELEELRNKLKEAEGTSTRASSAQQEAEKREAAFRSRQSDLEDRAVQAQEELTELRSAMTSLRDALDQSERQVSSLCSEASTIRASLHDRDIKLEKLQKASKSMAEEMRQLQTSKLRQNSTTAASSRSSLESTNRVMSPVGGPRNGTPGTQKEDAVDYVYLKNVLLQFLETREKKLQLQLVPVLGMLLHFDKQDMGKWNAAVTAR